MLVPLSINKQQVYTCKSSSIEDTGLQVTIPANSIYSLTSIVSFSNSPVLSNVLYINNKAVGGADFWSNASTYSIESASVSGYAAQNTIVKVYGRWHVANTSNLVAIYGFYLTINKS